MRHLGSLLLAMLTAPLALVLAGRGLGNFLEASAAPSLDPLTTATSVAALVLAGMLLALLTLPRFSPLGPVLAGVGYLSIGLWALADLNQFQSTVQADVVGLDEQAVTMTAGASLLLAMPLLLTLFSAQRWRGREKPPPASYAPPAGYPAPAATQQAAPAHPLDSTQEFPAVPEPQWPTEPVRQWPAAPPGPVPTVWSLYPPAASQSAGEEQTTDAIPVSGIDQPTEQIRPD